MSFSVTMQIEGDRSSSGVGHNTELTPDTTELTPDTTADTGTQETVLLDMEALALCPSEGAPEPSGTAVSAKRGNYTVDAPPSTKAELHSHLYILCPEQEDPRPQVKQLKAQPGGSTVVVPMRSPGDAAGPAHPSSPHRQPDQTSYQQAGSSFTKTARSSRRARDSNRGGLAELEHRQAEKRREMLKPNIFTAPSPRALAQRLESENGGATGPAVVRTQRSRCSLGSGSNNKNVKQMLLDWCRAKTRMYENVDIQNFSSSWSDGLAFCALVHAFFPQAFDYSSLDPRERRHNFHTAFSVAEQKANCPRLLEVEDLVRMEVPDWKCVYTYIQEFYRCLVDRGLVKTKKTS